MWCYCIFVYNILRQMNDQCVISRWWSWQNALCDHRFLRRLIDSPFALHQLENGQLHTQIQKANTNTKCKHKYSNAPTQRNTKYKYKYSKDRSASIGEWATTSIHSQIQNTITKCKHKYSVDRCVTVRTAHGNWSWNTYHTAVIETNFYWKCNYKLDTV